VVEGWTPTRPKVWVRRGADILTVVAVAEAVPARPRPRATPFPLDIGVTGVARGAIVVIGGRRIPVLCLDHLDANQVPQRRQLELDRCDHER
jgi:hypothetical protein